MRVLFVLISLLSFSLVADVINLKCDMIRTYDPDTLKYSPTTGSFSVKINNVDGTVAVDAVPFQPYDERGNKIIFLTGNFTDSAQVIYEYEIDRVSGFALEKFFIWDIDKDDIPEGEKWNTSNYVFALEHEALCKPVKPLF
jgi:hypothetical protein